MIYLISRNKTLWNSANYNQVSFDWALQQLPVKEVQLDTETAGLDCHTNPLLTLQLGTSDNQFVFDWTTLNNQEKLQLKKYLESNVVVIGHNLSFDLTFLYVQDIWPKKIYDTMIAEQLIYLGYPRVISSEIAMELNLEFPDYEYIETDDKGVSLYSLKRSPYYELSYSLKATAKRRLKINLDKSVRGEIVTKGLTESVIIYAANDVKWLQQIKEKQLEELSKQQLLKAIEFECEVIKHVAYTKYCGIHLNKSKWLDKMKSDQLKYDQAKKNLDTYVINLDKEEIIKRVPKDKKEEQKLLELGFTYNFDSKNYEFPIKNLFVEVNLQGNLFEGFNTDPICTINWSSSQQVIKLFELLGIQVDTFDKKTKKKKKSIEEKQISPQKDKFPIINTFLEYQEAAKVISTYGENWLRAINPNTGRIHVEIHSIGTDTARMSSGGGVYRLNQQNLPHDQVTRACFTAEEGNLWLSCDFSGQESCITASVSNDSKMCEILNSGGDLHSEVARSCWPELLGNLTIEEIKTKYKEYRQSAKGIEFGVFYGGDDNTLVANKGFSPEQAKEIYNNFMNTFSGLKQYQAWRRAEVLEKGYILMNPNLGHRAHIYDIEWMFSMKEKFKEEGFWEYYRTMKRDHPTSTTVQQVKRFFKRKSEIERQSINYCIQNRGAMCMKLAMIKLFNWIISNNYQNIVKICAIVHDECNLEVPESLKDEVSKIIIQCMEAGGKPFCSKVHLGADLSVGEYWIH